MSTTKGACNISATMTVKEVLFVVIISLLSFGFAQHGSGTLPIRISLGGTGGSVCPLQSTINVELNVTIMDTIHSILDQKYISPGSCNGTGWIRVAFLYMTDPSEVCPSSLSLHTFPVRGCGRQEGTPLHCNSILFTQNIQGYSNVCGRILAYQKGGPEAFWNNIVGSQSTIESAYVDGVSLTHGPAGSRQHIWTFAAAVYETHTNYGTQVVCSCTNTQYNWMHQVPAFMTLEIVDLGMIVQPITLMTLSGMVKDVAHSVLVASLILPHGSRQHYHRLPVMTLNYVSAMMN